MTWRNTKEKLTLFCRNIEQLIRMFLPPWNRGQFQIAKAIKAFFHLSSEIKPGVLAPCFPGGRRSKLVI